MSNGPLSTFTALTSASPTLTFIGVSDTAVGPPYVSKYMTLTVAAPTLSPLLQAIPYATALIVDLNAVAAPGLGAITGKTIVGEFTGADSTSPTVFIDSFNGSSSLALRSTGGTNASPTFLVGGANIGSIDWFGYYASAYSNASRTRIVSKAAENWSSTANGTFLSFLTTPSTTLLTQEQVRIFGSGGVAIGNSIISTDPGVGNLSIGGTTFHTGNVGIGTAPTTTSSLTLSYTNVAASASYAGAALTAVQSQNTTPYAGQSIGLQVITSVGTGNNQNWTTASGAALNGIATTASIAAGATGVISSANGVTVTISNGATGATLTSAASIFVKAPTLTGPISNYTGLILGGTAGTYPTGNNGIYQYDSYTNLLTGNLTVGVTSTASLTNKIIVAGSNAGGFGPLVQWTDGSGAVGSVGSQNSAISGGTRNFSVTAQNAVTVFTNNGTLALTLGTNQTASFTGLISQSVTTAGPANVLLTQNASAGTTAYAQMGIANSINNLAFAMTSTTFAASFLTNGPTGQLGVIYTTASVPLAIGINTTIACLFDTIGGATFYGKAVSKGQGGIGYATGAGGTVVQGTNKSTSFTLDKVAGQITFATGALAGDATASSTWSNIQAAVGDIVVFNHISGGTIGAYTFNAQAGSGTITLQIHNATPGSLTEQPVVQFAIIRGATS